MGLGFSFLKQIIPIPCFDPVWSRGPHVAVNEVRGIAGWQCPDFVLNVRFFSCTDRCTWATQVEMLEGICVEDSADATDIVTTEGNCAGSSDSLMFAFLKQDECRHASSGGFPPHMWVLTIFWVPYWGPY